MVACSATSVESCLCLKAPREFPNADECFRLDKNGLHGVTAQGRFKMSLLLVLE